jgi:hypothetical protein
MLKVKASGSRPARAASSRARATCLPNAAGDPPEAMNSSAIRPARRMAGSLEPPIQMGGPPGVNGCGVDRQRDGASKGRRRGPGRAGAWCVHGARALEASVLDELQIDQIPVLFGGGRRLFDVLPSRVELEIVRVIGTPEATHIRYRVRR